MNQLFESGRSLVVMGGFSVLNLINAAKLYFASASVEILIPYLTVVSLCVGIVGGILTIYLAVRKIREGD